MSSKHEFNSHMKWALNIVNSKEDIEDKILLLDYHMNVIKYDLKHTYLSDLPKPYTEPINLTFPLCYYDEDNTYKSVVTDQYKQIDLSKDIVVTKPHNKFKLVEALHILKRNEFIFDNDNHKGYYFPGMDVTLICNGFHSITAGIINKKGIIMVQICDDIELFGHLYTDGNYFYNIHTRKAICEVDDVKLAVLYSLASQKQRLEYTTFY